MSHQHDYEESEEEHNADEKEYSESQSDDQESQSYNQDCESDDHSESESDDDGFLNTMTWSFVYRQKFCRHFTNDLGVYYQPHVANQYLYAALKALSSMHIDSADFGSLLTVEQMEKGIKDLIKDVHVEHVPMVTQVFKRTLMEVYSITVEE